VKKSTAGVPWRQRMEDMGYTPAEISRMEIDRAADAMNAQTATDPTAPSADVPRRRPRGS
jgi:hypothetical protein